MDILLNDIVHKFLNHQQKRTLSEKTADQDKSRPPAQFLTKLLSDIVCKIFDHQEKAAPAEQTADHASPLLPVQALTKHVGEALEVHYMDAGLSQVINACLSSSPNKNSFYLTLNDNSTTIFYWYNHESDGSVSGVKLIKVEGEVLYSNDALPFNYEKAERHGHDRIFQGPIRKKTRDYLSGKFG